MDREPPVRLVSLKATAWRCGLPALISRSIFAEMILREDPRWHVYAFGGCSRVRGGHWGYDVGELGCIADECG
jgi:hypothetical protein